MTTREIDWYRCPLPKETMQALNKRSDFLGFLQSGGHLGLLILTGTAAFYTQQHGMYWAMAGLILVHGMIASFYINAVHELVHGTVFRSQWLNWLFVHIFSFFGWINHYAFWASHTEHHKYTLNQPDDLEVTLPTKHQRGATLKHGIINPWGLKWTIIGTWKKVLGKFEGEWEQRTCDPATRKKVVTWARIVFLGHLSIAAVSIYFGYWIIPILTSMGHVIGSGPHQLCNAVQHAGLVDNVNDFRLSCRTIILGPVLRFLYWHMNYHIEHHMFAAVPCYRLGKLHKLIKHELPPCKNLRGAWKEIFEIQDRQEQEPDYQYHQPLPTPGHVVDKEPAKTEEVQENEIKQEPINSENQDLKIWECSVCGFIYDESKGLPKEGIAAGTRWQDIPEDWSCPDCGVSKEDFDMVEMQLAS